MKKGDYKTFSQAREYHLGRFKNGLKRVNLDEMRILEGWLANIHIKNKIVLDLGTGTGRIVDTLLKQEPKKIYALDQSKAMLDYLTQIFKTQIEKQTVETINSSSDDISLKSNSLDLVTAFHLFKHLPNITPTVTQIRKVLKPGGYFIFDILNQKSLVRFSLADCFGLTYKQTKRILEQQGFVVNDMVYLHPLGETVYDVFEGLLSLFPKVVDNILDVIKLKIGTKILFLAKKI